MHDRPSDDDQHRGADRILVAVGPGRGATEVVLFGKRLADALQTGWQAVHVETPSHSRSDNDPTNLAEALGLAAQLGASVVKIAAATVADGLCLQLDNSPAEQLVMGRSGRSGGLGWRRPLVEILQAKRPDLFLHLVPGTAEGPSGLRIGVLERSPWISHGYAAAAVIITLAAALILNRFTGVRSLSILFLFPVIAAAARLGIRPALTAALLSAAAFNFFFLNPAYVLKIAAIQSLVMGGVLAAVALYTGVLTSTLRGRIALSDRSAQENASLAAFALKLTRVSDWTATAETVCEQVSALLNVQAMILREVSGSLEIAAAVPGDASLAPLDRTALDWAWSHGEPAGSGTSILSAADWQFQPLRTSLGTLAVLGLAREDGRNPVPADQAVLVATLVAQAALAHERLRLEDMMRAGQIADE